MLSGRGTQDENEAVMLPCCGSGCLLCIVSLFCRVCSDSDMAVGFERPVPKCSRQMGSAGR